MLRKIILFVVVVAVGIIGGPWVYINVITDEAPVALVLESTVPAVAESAETTVVESASIEGTWVVAADSVVGYRAKEILFGQSTEGVGRTYEVTGSLNIVGQKVTAATFDVDMTTLKSDSVRRDRQVNTRILDTVTYPNASFTLLSSIELTPESIAGGEIATTSLGTLTLRGVSKEVNADITARLTDGVMVVNGAIKILFSDFLIPDPSIPGISVEKSGMLEFLIRFSQK